MAIRKYKLIFMRLSIPFWRLDLFWWKIPNLFFKILQIFNNSLDKIFLSPEVRWMAETCISLIRQRPIWVAEAANAGILSNQTIITQNQANPWAAVASTIRLIYQITASAWLWWSQATELSWEATTARLRLDPETPSQTCWSPDIIIKSFQKHHRMAKVVPLNLVLLTKSKL